MSLDMLLLVAILCLCCCSSGSQNETSAIGHNTKENRRPKRTNDDHCEFFMDHCSRRVDDNIDGDGPRAKGGIVPAVPPEDIRARSQCFCDEQCRKYGDCCLDMVANEVENIKRQYSNGTTTMEQTTANLPAMVWKCQRVSLRQFWNIYIYVIGSCPAEYPDIGIRQMCERTVEKDHYDYYLDIPVISKSPNVTYANIYCALCHNISHVYRSIINIYCLWDKQNCTNDIHLWKYLPKTWEWTYNSIIVTYEIAIEGISSTEMLDYQATFGGRQCRPTVDSCPSSWPGVREHLLYATYAFYIRLPNFGDYKNKYCAKCHQISVKEETIMCPTWFDNLFGHETGPPSYSILLGMQNFIGQVDIDKQPCGTCKLGEFCEPLRNICKPLTCSSNYEMDANRKCIKRLSLISINGTATRAALDCPMRYIHLDEFVWQPNNSIYVNVTGQTLTVSEYEMVNTTTLLVCIEQSNTVFKGFSIPQVILSTICVICSLTCLAIHITVHILLPQLRNLPGMNLLCLSTSLFVAQFLFEFCFQASNSSGLCVTIAILAHYAFLASFFWMKVMAFDVCRTFARRTPQPCSHHDFCKYCTYAWFTPFLIVVLAICNNAFAFLPQFDPMYGERLCWINNHHALFLFFVAPIGVLLLENVILFVMTTASIIHATKMGEFARRSSSTSCNSERNRFLIYLKLAVIMGLTWVFGFIAAFANVDALWYLFIILNASQGVFIFLAFTCKRKVYDMLKTRFRHQCGPRTKDNHDIPSFLVNNIATHSTNMTTISRPSTPTQPVRSHSSVNNCSPANLHPDYKPNAKGP